MSKNFRAKKIRHHFIKLRYLLFIGIIYLSFDTTYAYLLDRKTKIDNDMYLKMFLSSTNNHFKTDYQPKRLLNEVVLLISNIDVTNPSNLLSININNDTVVPVTGNYDAHTDDYDPNAQEKITKYIKDPNPTTINKPIIYIYNSHQLENYSATNLEIYNITPNVMMASYMLKEKLNDLGIGTIVNESNLAEFIRINNWSHKDSYKASRIFILDAKNKYDTLEYYIDIHRDAINKKESTVKIGGKTYAKTLFVVGLENSNYVKNLELVTTLNAKINELYPGLSRGILKKEGKGVDGVYNQDISPRCILIEIGGYESTFEEVMMSVDAIAKVLYAHIKGDS